MVTLHKCQMCEAAGIKQDVPTGGQCPKCGFVEGFRRLPTDQEFVAARDINRKNNVPLFRNVDMVLVEVANEVAKK
jgi:hypothetical protein